MAIVAVLAAVFVRLATFAGAGASAMPGPLDLQPIAIPASPVTCDGAPTGSPYPVGVDVVIPIGKACPQAASWLRWDDGHGAGAGQDAVDLVGWILEPDTAGLVLPSWQRTLPGRPESRLRDAEAALNTLDGTVIELGLMDASRGTGDGLEVELAGTAAFQLKHAYIARSDVACGSSANITCLVGSFTLLPSSAPSTTPRPTSTATSRPTPSPSPSPSVSSSPSPSPSGTPAPTPSPSAGPSGSPEPGASTSPSPSGEPGGSPSPSPSLPPDAFVELRLPSSITIPLARNTVNSAEVTVDVQSNVPWTLVVRDLDGGPTRGHMVALDGGVPPLELAMTARIGPSGETPLDAPTPVRLTTGSGSSTLVIDIQQAVEPTDAPGAYGIRLLFTAIAGF